MNIVRLYNQNRKNFWMAILIIVSFIIVLQIINSAVGEKQEKKLENISNNNSFNTMNNETIESSKIESNYSSITGGEISNEKLVNTKDILNNFFLHCNNRNLDKAYEMLTDECKELMYPNIESFKSNYYDNVFEEQNKAYSFENWYKDTYLVTIKEDALSLGKLPDETNEKIDYITIVNEKLNISAYIGRTEINKEVTNKGINFTVNYKDTYMEREVYNITFKNTTNTTVCLAETDEPDNLFLVDENNIRYYFYNTEIAQNQLILISGASKTVDIKFASSFVSTKQIKGIAFKNVFLDYENNKDNIEHIFVQVKT